MTKNEIPPNPPALAREKRRAEALRANLRRRKAQARARGPELGIGEAGAGAGGDENPST